MVMISTLERCKVLELSLRYQCSWSTQGVSGSPSKLIQNQVPEQVEEVVEVVNPNQQRGDTQRRFCNDRFGQAATIRLATGVYDTKRAPYQSRDAVSHPHDVIT